MAAVCPRWPLFRLVVAVVVATSGCGEPPKPPPKNFKLVELSPSDGELTALLKAHVKKAKAAGQRPFVEFYADWCRPCRALRNSLDDARMIDAFDGTYIIQLDADAWKDRLSGARFWVSAIPVFFEISEEGNPTGRSIDPSAWKDETPADMAPALKRFFQE
jgi:thiol:disulfide interchange protein